MYEMKKFILIVLMIIIIIAGGIFFTFQPDAETKLNSENESNLQVNDVEVIMPSKSSRPGCEKNDLCYIPSEITIKIGDSITWQNQDVAFHSVTSGFYESPEDLFDSGHLDPNQKYSIKFEEEGIFNYFCSLHPWMMGKVTVE